MSQRLAAADNLLHYFRLHPAESAGWISIKQANYIHVPPQSGMSCKDRDLFRWAPESLLVCSLIVETLATNLSSEEATEDFKSKTSTWGTCCDKSAVVTAPCLVSRIFVSIFLSHAYGRNKSQHWQSSICRRKATYPRMSPGFPEAPFKTHHRCAIHPPSTD
jgi:hypothetical protein